MCSQGHGVKDLLIRMVMIMMTEQWDKHFTRSEGYE